MRAGTLRELVTIQALVPAGETEWGKVDQWQDVAEEIWASVKTIAAGESVKDQGVQASVKYEVRMRYRDGVTSDNRLLWRGRTLDIVSVIDPENRRRELVIEAAEHQEQ